MMTICLSNAQHLKFHYNNAEFTYNFYYKLIQLAIMFFFAFH